VFWRCLLHYLWLPQPGYVLYTRLWLLPLICFKICNVIYQSESYTACIVDKEWLQKSFYKNINYTMNTSVSEDWNNIYTFKEIYFGLNITVTWPPFTNAATLQLVKKCPPNNSLMRGLKTVVYSCLMQHYEEQILNKNKIRNGFISTKSCNSKKNSDYHKIKECPPPPPSLNNNILQHLHCHPVGLDFAFNF